METNFVSVTMRVQKLTISRLVSRFEGFEEILPSPDCPFDTVCFDVVVPFAGVDILCNKHTFVNSVNGRLRVIRQEDRKVFLVTSIRDD